MGAASHPRLDALVQRARERARTAPLRIGLVYPCDAAAIDAAVRIVESGLAQPVLIGPRAAIERAAAAAGADAVSFEIVDSGPGASEAARRATAMARAGELGALMKGSLHTDELMSAVVDRHAGLRGDTRMSHVFLFDLPRYPKLLGLADCVVNIAPSLAAKRDILGNAVRLLQTVGIAQPLVAVVAAVETVNPAIPATVDAQALAELAKQGAWPGALVEGPFGFDNAISAEAALTSVQEAKKRGIPVSCDLNFRKKLWKWQPGKSATTLARETMRGMMPYIDCRFLSDLLVSKIELIETNR